MPNAQITIMRLVLYDDALSDNGAPLLGVLARASIRVPFGADWITSTLNSPGLWGIDSDMEDSYLDEIFQEERTILLDMLESLKTYEVVE